MEYIDDALVEEALQPAAFPRRNRVMAKWGMMAACAVVIGISATAFWYHQNIKEARIESQVEGTAAAVDDSGSADDTKDQMTAAGAGDGMAGSAVSGDSSAGSTDSGGMDTFTQDIIADNAASVEQNAEAGRQEGSVESAKEGELAEAKQCSYKVINDYYAAKAGSAYDDLVPGQGKSSCSQYLQETMNYYEDHENTERNTDSPIYAYDVVVDLYGESEGAFIHLNSDNGSEVIEQEYRRLAALGYAVRLSEDFQLTGTFTKAEIETFQASPEYGYTFRFASEH
jgi:hypothetical protein